MSLQLLSLNFDVFIYLKQRQKYITQKSILKFNKHNAPLCLRYSDLHTFVLQVQ